MKPLWCWPSVTMSLHKNQLLIKKGENWGLDIYYMRGNPVEIGDVWKNVKGERERCLQKLCFWDWGSTEKKSDPVKSLRRKKIPEQLQLPLLTHHGNVENVCFGSRRYLYFIITPPSWYWLPLWIRLTTLSLWHVINVTMLNWNTFDDIWTWQYSYMYFTTVWPISYRQKSLSCYMYNSHSAM